MFQDKSLRLLKNIVIIMGLLIIFGMLLLFRIVTQKLTKSKQNCKKGNFEVAGKINSITSHKNKIYLLSKDQEIYVFDLCSKEKLETIKLTSN